MRILHKPLERARSDLAQAGQFRLTIGGIMGIIAVLAVCLELEKKSKWAGAMAFYWLVPAWFRTMQETARRCRGRFAGRRGRIVRLFYRWSVVAALTFLAVAVACGAILVPIIGLLSPIHKIRINGKRDWIGMIIVTMLMLTTIGPAMLGYYWVILIKLRIRYLDRLS